MTPIDLYAAADAATVPAEALRLIRATAPRFRDWFRATGKPDVVVTCDLASVPYPTRFGTWGAARSPVPFVTITNRMLVVRWTEPGLSRPRTLLFEPTDLDLARNAPFYAQLARSTPKALEPLVYREHGSVLAHLARLGIAATDVDFLTFDHLHIQDVRRLIGTRAPAADLSPFAPVQPLFPNAKLVVQRRELELVHHMHPLQGPWYQPATFVDLRPESLAIIDGDVLVGPGVALLSTPGHSAGNHSLVLHTDSGIWASSENVIAAEFMTPEHSRIAGLSAWRSAFAGLEVVLNANTLESSIQQYNSVIKEKSIVDAAATDERFLQFFPSSELTAAWTSPGVKPTFLHRAIRHGAMPAAGHGPAPATSRAA
jgi:hypothetical protein